MKFSFYTLGCKVNQYETQAMEQKLLERGHCLEKIDQPCDGFIINTCTVTAVSDKKCRNIIRRVRKENPDAVVGVCGCYAQTNPEDIRKLQVDILAGTGERMAFLDAVVEQAAGRTKARSEFLDKALTRREFEVLPAGGLSSRTRAMLKVQDGCCNFCSYCIIPYARGPVRSLPLSQAVEQAIGVAKDGYKEIVITGIEISSWGMEWKDGSNLVDLLGGILTSVPTTRVRLGSLEPRTITEEFCNGLKAFANLCPQFHLSLQSGSDTVLARMNRKYNTARYMESVRLLREAFPHCAITTDVIVAFPEESEEEFQETLAFMEDCQFAAVHVFPYSRREGTPAASITHQHNNETKGERSAMANALATLLEGNYQSQFVGKTLEVLFEQPHEEGFMGHGENYIPVVVKKNNLHNQIKTVKILEKRENYLFGEIL